MSELPDTTSRSYSSAAAWLNAPKDYDSDRGDEEGEGEDDKHEEHEESEEFEDSQRQDDTDSEIEDGDGDLPPGWKSAWHSKKQATFCEDTGEATLTKPEEDKSCRGIQHVEYADSIEEAEAQSNAPLQEKDEDLPLGWASAWCPAEAAKYYYNLDTREATWTKPQEDKSCRGIQHVEYADSIEETEAQSNAPLQEKDEDLPLGWASAWCPAEAAKYYYNLDTREATWTKPQVRCSTDDPDADESMASIIADTSTGKAANRESTCELESEEAVEEGWEIPVHWESARRRNYAVAWHVLDHVVGEVFDNFEDARRKFNRVRGGYYSIVMYDSDMTECARDGKMASKHWRTLIEWCRSSLTQEVGSTPEEHGRAKYTRGRRAKYTRGARWHKEQLGEEARNQVPSSSTSGQSSLAIGNAPPGFQLEASAPLPSPFLPGCVGQIDDF